MIDIDGYIDIGPEDTKKIKIKNEGFIYKRTTIILKYGTNYTMNFFKKFKRADYYQENSKKFVEMYK